MKLFLLLAATAIVSASATARAGDIILASFDGAKATTRSFRELNDPVMGGKSTGTFTTSSAEGGYGIFDGQVVNVPALKAPGFIKAQSEDSSGANAAFQDISKCKAMVITARAKYPYDGYKLQFGDKRSLFCSFFSSGFKAPFAAPVGSAFQRVVIPLTDFSDCNSDSTGQPKKLCNETSSVCPDANTLKDVKTVAVWAEGAAGQVHLEIQSIAATGCPGAGPAPSTENIVQIAAGNKDFSTLVTALKAAGLVSALEGKGPFTVFAPTNEAFAKLPAGTLQNLLKPENKAKLVSILEYHVVAGTAAYAKDLTDGEMIKTLEGQKVEVHITKGGVRINNSNVIKADIGASNGVIHAIDTVLLPSAGPQNTKPALRTMKLDMTAVQAWAAAPWDRAVAASASPGDHCAASEYCCPDALHCLTPTKTSCAKDASVCSADQTCCPLTKLCVHVGKPCASPCKEANTYCCPDALACLEPTNPGVLCGDASDCNAANGEVCCPLTKICVKPHEKCQPLPAFMQAVGAGSDVVLATFDGAKGTTRKWQQQNDPVMGGKSTGTFSISNGVGTMDGDVVNVPFLKAPGFIKASTVDVFTPFPDVSHCNAIKLTARAKSGFKGYRLSFGTAHPPGGKRFSYGFKAHFDAPTAGANGAFQDIVLPFDQFTDLWDDATGDAIKTCAQDKVYCPDAKTLKNMATISVWAEGVAGKVHLDIKQIAATGCGAAPASAFAVELGNQNRIGKDTCGREPQSQLRYIGASPTRVPDLALPLAQGETLADAICCDSAFAPYAEPRWYYNHTEVGFFAKVKKAYQANGNKPITFYDSVCGEPLFRVPINRTLADFMAETKEHGWPSFRPAELVTKDAVKILPNNYVVSKCGTHLGSNVPDAKGIRYCLDLSCVSGNPAK